MIVDTDKLMSLKQVSAKLNRAPAGIYDRITKGTFPQALTIGEHKFWVADEIDEWIAKNQNPNMIRMRQVCNMTGLTRQQVISQIKKNRFPPGQMIGDVRHWKRQYIEEWLEHNRDSKE